MIKNFVAVIAPDKKSFYYADEEGMLEGKIASEDKVEIVYRHVTDSETVIAVGTWTRKK